MCVCVCVCVCVCEGEKGTHLLCMSVGLAALAAVPGLLPNSVTHTQLTDEASHWVSTHHSTQLKPSEC